MAETQRTALRRRVHDILELDRDHDPLTNTVNGFLVVLICLNVVAFAAETVPDMHERYGTYFYAFNLFSIAVFTIEYVLRIWSSVDIPILRDLPPWKARARFAARPLQIIDLLAILPFYLSFIIPMDLRVLRILRIFRFLKLARYSPALETLGRVIANERRALVGALFVMVTLLLFASTGIYFLERHIQPEYFGSIPAAAWWALATLTTVGYGDVVPITPGGKLFGGLIMVFGLGMFALPIAIIASGFSREAGRRDFVVTWSMVAQVPIFAQLDAVSVASIMSLLNSRSYEAGDKIVVAGTEARAMFFVTSGRVEVRADGEPVILGEGDFFGELALLEHRMREHTVVALTKCRLLVLEKDDLVQLCRQAPEIYQHIDSVAKARAQAATAAKSPARPRQVAAK